MTPERPKTIETLTGLRGLAAGIVFVSHAAIVGFLPTELGHGFGQVGVMLFFVLSGFLMALLYADKDFTRSTVTKYALSRVGRVVPLYLAVIAISLIASQVYPSFRYQFSGRDVLTSLLFLQAPWELWTIPVEMQFYVVFVILWAIVARRGPERLGRWMVTLVVLVSMPTIATILLLHEKYSIVSTYGFAFFVGAFVGINFDRLRNTVMPRTPWWAGYVFLVLLFANLPELRMDLGLSLSSGYWVSTWLDPLTWIVVLGLFLASAWELRSTSYLKSRLFSYLGKISYGFYLIHYPILMLMADLVGINVVGFILATAASLTLSSLSYRYFEVPAMRLIRGSKPAHRQA